MLDNYAEWGSQAFISALSGFASFFSGELNRVVVPSQYAGTNDFHWADHIEVNSIWQTDSVTLSFDSGDVPRPVKVSRVAEDATALKNLRVCWRATNELNCSQCEKCLRTMVALDIAGASKIASTFNWPLGLNSIAQLRLENDVLRNLWAENLDAARIKGRVDLVNAIKL